MGLWGVLMVAANAAQLAIWGKQALESERGQAAVQEIKRKAGEAGDRAGAVAATAGVVAGEAGRVIVETSRPIREAAAEKIEGWAEKIERMTSGGPPTNEEVQEEIDRAAAQCDEVLSDKPAVDIEGSDDPVKVTERRGPPDLPNPAEEW